MKTPSLTVFANFFIDNKERFQRMKDSFFSFKDSKPDEWRINIRGRLKYDAGEFLAKELRKDLTLNYKESKEGWFYDSYSFMKDCKSDFIFFWIEDHLCVSDPSALKYVLFEMKKYNTDLLLYSWYHFKTLNTFNRLPKIKEGKHIEIAEIDKKFSYHCDKDLKNTYIVSALSIFKNEFFFKVLLSNRPYFKRWPKYLPFHFEKKIKDRVSEKIVYAIPKYELFALIDEGVDIPGYSLISRGLYPNRYTREELKNIEFGPKKTWKIILRKYLPNFILPPLLVIWSMLIRLRYTIKWFI